MGLSKRHPEQYGTTAAHAGAERVGTGTQNSEASPQTPGSHRKAKHAKLPVSAHADPGQDRESPPHSRVRTGIVSVNGQDVGEMRCTGGRGSA